MAYGNAKGALINTHFNYYIIILVVRWMDSMSECSDLIEITRS